MLFHNAETSGLNKTAIQRKEYLYDTEATAVLDVCGCAGIVLIDATGVICDFISYEGTFTPSGGVAVGETPFNLPVQVGVLLSPNNLI